MIERRQEYDTDDDNFFDDDDDEVDEEDDDDTPPVLLRPTGTSSNPFARQDLASRLGGSNQRSLSRRLNEIELPSPRTAESMEIPDFQILRDDRNLFLQTIRSGLKTLTESDSINKLLEKADYELQSLSQSIVSSADSDLIQKYDETKAKVSAYRELAEDRLKALRASWLFPLLKLLQNNPRDVSRDGRSRAMAMNRMGIGHIEKDSDPRNALEELNRSVSQPLPLVPPLPERLTDVSTFEELLSLCAVYFEVQRLSEEIDTSEEKERQIAIVLSLLESGMPKSEASALFLQLKENSDQGEWRKNILKKIVQVFETMWLGEFITQVSTLSSGSSHSFSRTTSLGERVRKLLPMLSERALEKSSDTSLPEIYMGILTVTTDFVAGIKPLAIPEKHLLPADLNAEYLLATSLNEKIKKLLQWLAAFEYWGENKERNIAVVEKHATQLAEISLWVQSMRQFQILEEGKLQQLEEAVSQKSTAITEYRTQVDEQVRRLKNSTIFQEYLEFLDRENEYKVTQDFVVSRE